MLMDHLPPTSNPRNAAATPVIIDAARYVLARTLFSFSSSSFTSIITVENVEKEPKNPDPMIVTSSPEGDPPRRTPKRNEAMILAIKVPDDLPHLREFCKVQRSTEPIAARRINRTKVKILLKCDNSQVGIHGVTHKAALFGLPTCLPI